MVLTAAALHLGALGGYEFWVRTIDDKGGVALHSSRAALSSNWEKVRIRLQVAPNAQKLEIGFGVRGKQKLVVKDLHFDEASADQAMPEVKPRANRIPLAEMTQAFEKPNFKEVKSG